MLNFACLFVRPLMCYHISPPFPVPSLSHSHRKHFYLLGTQTIVKHIFILVCSWKENILLFEMCEHCKEWQEKV